MKYKILVNPLYFLYGLCEKYTDILVYVKNNVYFCKTRFRKQYNNGINNENKNYGSSAAGGSHLCLAARTG